MRRNSSSSRSRPSTIAGNDLQSDRDPIRGVPGALHAARQLHLQRRRQTRPQIANSTIIQELYATCQVTNGAFSHNFALTLCARVRLQITLMLPVGFLTACQDESNRLNLTGTLKTGLTVEPTGAYNNISFNCCDYNNNN